MFIMQHQRIINVFLLFAGIIQTTQAILTATITSHEPKTGVVFHGDVIQLTCEASDSRKAPIITWHLDNSYAPAMANSSATRIISRIQGNKTIGLLTTTNFAASNVYIFCKASTGTSKANTNFLFSYVKERPKLQVTMARTQTVAEGTRRHVLSCKVGGNVNVKLATVRWIYAGRTLKEERIELKRGILINRSMLLQCLTEKDLGDYACAVNVTLYQQTWNNSATITLKGNIAGNTGMNINPTAVQLLCLPLILLGNIF